MYTYITVEPPPTETLCNKQRYIISVLPAVKCTGNYQNSHPIVKCYWYLHAV